MSESAGDPSLKVAEWELAGAVYKLGEQIDLFRWVVEHLYTTHPFHLDEGPDGELPIIPDETPVPRRVSEELGIILNLLGTLTERVPVATGPAGSMAAAAQVIRDRFIDSWLGSEHRDHIRALMKMDPCQILLQSPFGRAGWAEYEATARMLGESIPPPWGDLFCLARELAAVPLSPESSFAPHLGEYLGFDPAHIRGTIGPQVTRRIRVINERTRWLAGIPEEFVGDDAYQAACNLRVRIEKRLERSPPSPKWLGLPSTDVLPASGQASPFELSTDALPQQKSVGRTVSTPAESPDPSSEPSRGKRATERPLTSAERTQLLEVRKELGGNQSLVGDSDAILLVVRKIHECGVSGHKTVLVTGASGTGKTSVAQMLHNAWRKAPDTPSTSEVPDAAHQKGGSGRSPANASQGRQGPTPTVGGFTRWQAGRSHGGDAQIPKSELLGVAPNSGLSGIPPAGTIGLLKQYEGGTIFIDEFAQASPELQALLLDAAEGKPLAPIGSHKSFIPNIRLVFATNEGLDNIRQDLLYRIQFRFQLPDLADRIEDVFALARHFLSSTGLALDARTWLLLLQYRWPGNVRELENCIKAAVGRFHTNEQLAGKNRRRQSTPPVSSERVSQPGGEGKRARTPSPPVIPFEIFAEMEELSEVAKAVPTDPIAAERNLMEVLDAMLRDRGHEFGKGLNARLGEWLGLRPYQVTRLRQRVTPPLTTEPATCETDSGASAPVLAEYGGPTGVESPGQATPTDSLGTVDAESEGEQKTAVEADGVNEATASPDGQVDLPDLPLPPHASTVE